MENDQCRGGSGDDPETLHACNRRYHLLMTLERRGWCWGGGRIGAEDHWLRCSMDPGYRPGQLGSAPPYSEQEIAELTNESALNQP